MLRASLAALAAALLVGVLALLIVESRAVKEEYYVAHAERVRAIETSKDDLAAIAQGSQGAFKEGRSIPATIDLAFDRLGENNTLLQAAYETSRQDDLQQQLESYDAAMRRFVGDGRVFAARQNALADALRSLQDESPAAVKDLRRFNLRIQSQNAFSLAIDIIEFASGQSRSDPADLSTRVEALRADSAVEAQAPGRLDGFVSAASAVITEHSAAETALERISRSGIAGELWALSDAIQSENRRIVDRAERARLLLAVCAVLLLAGTGYVVVRLQSSYRDLNHSNAELAKINNTLEDRVRARTEQLTDAFDELKESQVQLVQAEKMSSLGELVAGISHEINTPLWYLINNSTVVQERLEALSDFCDIAESMIGAVRSKTEVKEAVSRGLVDMHKMIEDGMKDDLDEARDLTQDSIDGLEELTELAQSLKDFSRLDRSRHGEFNVNEGLDKTLLILKNKLKNKVTVHKHYGDVPVIHCSPSQINQVFLNLITNASDAIAESGEILVKTWQDASSVCIGISDTGCGIPDDVMAKVRDPFFTTKEVGKGTGLGLSIVDRIVSSHGGELRVESEAGKGTAVTIVLPIKPAMESADVEPAPEEQPQPVAAPAPAPANDESGEAEPAPNLAAV